MIKIDSSYKVILTHSPIYEITGHIFECFDYYLFLKQYCKVGILFFDGLSLDQLKIAFESKYNISFNAIIDNIIFIPLDPKNRNYQTIVFGNQTVVILTDGHIKSLNHRKIILAATRLFGFLCEYDEFEKQLFNKNITYLADYRIYGKLRYFKSIDYVKKLPFKFYKKCNNTSLNRGMMYTTYVCRMITPEIILQYHEMSKCSQTLLVVPYAKPEYNNLPGIIQVVAPVDDFFNKFDTYIYTPVARRFDCSPRLLTECFMLGKKVICDVNYSDAGLDIRYNDCISNLDSLNLTSTDSILDILELC